ncbi:tape measure protein [Burkholderia singularis]|uniref:Phage tail length tape-measure protein n=1 Tax=Burkholderia singularis TaxID=1503053 RepID=A0A238H523_9BURK|nr:tape measure protein [Burkholderia singularis]SMG00330.1 Phage tail length tape-measure protein [Burkholderia singularis]
MATSLRELIVSVSANTTEYDRRMRGLSSTAGSYFNAVRDGGRVADAAFASNASSVQVTVRAIEAARGSIREYAQAAAAAFGAHKLVEYADEWTNLSNRLKIVTRDQIDFAVAQNDVLRIARDTRQPLDATGELYQRIANNATHLGMSIKQIGPLVETISKAVALSGVSADTARLGIIQLGQAFAAGQLRGQDLRSVLEELPGVADAIARGMGTSASQLKTLAEEGKLTVENLIDALTKAGSSTDALFAKVKVTVGQAMTRLQTEIEAYVGHADEATGASAKLAEGIVYVAKHLDGLVKIGVSLAAGRIAVYFGQSAVAATQATTAWLAARRALVEETTTQHEAAQAALAKAQSDRDAAAAKLQNAQAAEAAAQAEIAGMRAMRESLAMQSALTAGSIELAQAKLAEARAVEAAAQAHVASASANLAGSQEIGARIIGTPYAAIIARETAAAQQELERAEASLALAQQRRAALEAAASQGLVDQKRYAASLAETDRGLAAAERDVALATQARERAERGAAATAASLTAATERATAAQTALARTGTLMRSVGAGLLTAVGGLPGILMTVGTVALGAAANWLLFRDNANGATSSLIDMQAPLDQIIDKYRQLTPLLQEAERLRFEKGKESANDDAAAAYRSLAFRGTQAVMPPSMDGGIAFIPRETQEAIDKFNASLRAVEESTQSVVEKSRVRLEIIDEFVRATDGSRELRESLISAASAIDSAEGVAQKDAQALNAMEVSARGAANAVQLLTDANNFFAGGMAEEGWTKYVEKLKEASDIIGMTARQKAEYEAKSKGANAAEQKMAGLITGRAEEYKTLEKAIQDKDAKAAAGARANIDNLTRELALMNQQMKVASILAGFQAALINKKYDEFGVGAGTPEPIAREVATNVARARANAQGQQAYDKTLADAAAQTARITVNAPGLKHASGAHKERSTLEGERMLENIRQRIAQLRVEAVATDKLTQSEKDLLAFDQKVTDLRGKRKKLSDDDKSVLHDEAEIRAGYEQLAQLEKQARYRDAINKLKERSAQIDAELADYATERQRDFERELAAMSMGDNARELNQALSRVSDEFRRRRDELAKGARKDGTLGSPEYLAEISRINQAQAEEEENERGRHARRLERESQWRVGASRAMEQYQESAQNAAQMAEDAFSGFFRNAEDAFVSFAMTGKLNFRGLIDGMLSDLARFAARAAMSQAFGLLGSMLGLGGAALGFSSSSLLGGVSGSMTGALGGGAAAVGGNAFGFHLATGGPVFGPGTSTSDSIPAQLSNGEFVMRAAAVRRPGVRALLERLNAGGDAGFARFASGGYVGTGGAAANRDPNISVSANVDVNMSDSQGEGRDAGGTAGAQLRAMIETMMRQLMLSEMRPGGLLWQMREQRR